MDSKKNISVSSTQSGSVIKDVDADGKLVIKVFEAWKMKVLNKGRKFCNDKNSILKFLRLRKNFLRIVKNEKEKRIKTKIFMALRCFSKTKVNFSYIFLKKFLINWKKFAVTLKKSYKVSYIIQEKSFEKYEKKFFTLWRKSFLIQRKLSQFTSHNLKKRLKSLFSNLKQSTLISTNKRKSLNRLLTKSRRSNLHLSFSKWSHNSSKLHQISLKSQLQILSKSNFQQSQQIKHLQSQLTILNESLQQTFDFNSTSKTEISILLSKHAEDLYRSLCS